MVIIKQLHELLHTSFRVRSTCRTCLFQLGSTNEGVHKGPPKPSYATDSVRKDIRAILFECFIKSLMLEMSMIGPLYELRRWKGVFDQLEHLNLR